MDFANAPTVVDRRGFLNWAGRGIGAVALAALLQRDGARGAFAPGTGAIAAAEAAIAPGSGALPPHWAPKAKRAIHIVLVGGLSQVDSFDYKPALAKYHGKSLAAGEKPDVFFGQVGLIRQSDWEFKQRGHSGLWVSELFPHIASAADELTLIRSMVAETSNHTPATFQQNTGFRLSGFPVLGSWLSYGLGSVNENLPAFVVIPDSRQLPPGGSINWTNGFLPAQHQGVTFRANGVAVDNLFPSRPILAEVEQDSRALLASMNRRHQEARGDEDALSARVRSYELAARMQMAVPEVTDLSGETPTTQEMYGLGTPETNDFGRGCLLARRLLERGVRFVQLFSGGALGSPRINWDGHEDMKANHSQEARRIDRPVGALLHDLRRRGMLDDTLVLFTTEFGRTPFTQSAANTVGAGRDHNQYGFTNWMAGAGLKSGFSYGQTDEVGWKSAEDLVSYHDFHATVLHLLGIDHKRLTFYHSGIRRRITDVSGEVIRGVLA
jgi:hypothetical protein